MDFVHLTIGARYAADNGREPGQMRDVAGELARMMDRDRLRLVARVVYNLDLPRFHDEEINVQVACPKKHFSLPE